MSQPTVRLTAAQALIRYLQAQYTERDGVVRRAIPSIFAIFGHGNVLGLGQAIAQEGSDLPLYQPKNEQAMVHVACGFAKASRRLQTLACSASIGPGSTNMLTGAATATTNRLPVLLLPADTFASRRQGPVLQQLEHPTQADKTVNDLFRDVSRFFDRLSRPEQLLTALPEAMRVLWDPAETGAVTISIHQDVQGEAFDCPLSFFEKRIWHVARRPPEPSQIAAAAELITAAQRPVIIAGGGVRHSNAEDALEALADHIDCPVVETSAGKGTLAAGASRLLGGIGVNGSAVANEIAKTADLVICLGTRLSDFTTGSHSLFQTEGVRFVSINVNAADAHKLSATPIVADAREALDELCDTLPQRARRSYTVEVLDQVQAWRRTVTDHLAESPVDAPIGQAQVIAAIERQMGEGDWIVCAAGFQPGDVLKLWQTPAGSHTHIEFAYSCMGHEIPSGIGIRLHQPDEGEVIVLIGDGTYLMSPTEILTAVQEHLKLTIVVLDNRGYQSISGLAHGNLGQSIGNEFRFRNRNRTPDGEPLSVDYAANAASLGATTRTVKTAGELAAALADARAGEDTAVIVCATTNDPPLPASGAFWDLAVPEVSDDPETGALAAAVVKARDQQRSY